MVNAIILRNLEYLLIDSFSGYLGKSLQNSYPMGASHLRGYFRGTFSSKVHMVIPFRTACQYLYYSPREPPEFDGPPELRPILTHFVNM